MTRPRKPKEVKAKVVFNNCYGGFSLSDAAVRLGRKISGDEKWGGFTLVGEAYDDGSGICGERDGGVDMSSLFRDSNHPNDLSRHDPTLLKVVKTLGAAANGQHAKLKIEAIKGNRYRIAEYDGNEWVETPDGIDWTEITPVPARSKR